MNNLSSKKARNLVQSDRNQVRNQEGKMATVKSGEVKNDDFSKWQQSEIFASDVQQSSVKERLIKNLDTNIGILEKCKDRKFGKLRGVKVDDKGVHFGALCGIQYLPEISKDGENTILISAGHISGLSGADYCKRIAAELKNLKGFIEKGYLDDKIKKLEENFKKANENRAGVSEKRKTTRELTQRFKEDNFEELARIDVLDIDEKIKRIHKVILRKKWDKSNS